MYERCHLEKKWKLLKLSCMSNNGGNLDLEKNKLYNFPLN